MLLDHFNFISKTLNLPPEQIINNSFPVCRSETPFKKYPRKLDCPLFWSFATGSKFKDLVCYFAFSSSSKGYKFYRVEVKRNETN